MCVWACTGCGWRRNSPRSARTVCGAAWKRPERCSRAPGWSVRGHPRANEDTPEPLKDAFAALMESLSEVAGYGVHPGLITEVFWAVLHGLAALTRAGRLPPKDTEPRVKLLVDRLAMA
ncbi:TetR-like C-terminal domain-containing protein [Streptomyces sp. NPDC001275]